MKILLTIIVFFLILWIGWSYFGTRNIERPQILSTTMLSGWVEKRTIAPMIQAVVMVSGSQSQAINAWFRLIAWYIFGSNRSQASVAMTAPVASSQIEQSGSESIAMTTPVAVSQIEQSGSESIAMTTPVATEQLWSSYRVSFMMPSRYTLATLPVPTDPRVTLVEMPSQTYYVWSFVGYANASRAQSQLAKFIYALAMQDIKTEWLSTPILNQYNDPWTMPLMRHNEWWIAVGEESK